MADGSLESRGFLWQGGSIQDLGLIGPHAINDSGQIAGAYRTGSETHAFLLTSGTLQDLGTLGGLMSNASAINAVGQIAGWSTIPPNSGPHAFLRNGATMIELSPRMSWAYGINGNGQVVGSYEAIPGFFS